MGAGDLSAALWQERRELELLLFKLETQRLHIKAGNLQWLSFTASEVENVLDRLRFEALARSVESAAVAAEWGLPAQATLVELIAGAPAGSWVEILREHLAGLRDLLGQLGEAARAGEQLLRNLNLPASSGASPGGAAGTGPGTGPGTDTAQILEQLTTAANIERALIILQRTPQPLLAQYLDGEQGQ
ncbi:hypothetical protein QFZ79_000402 [Arthrobacter sp. V4I6]|uniref:flagellar export chaperone FlgN n=1 Tax=unclassified Arthrobacter TaxID=235627 RepID=UPI0027898D4A|nr:MULTISPECIES: flagellar export chaperone FlgN [unclassified Arthrobacter]MDQ0822663.1 hypothetical protein [Arthrobacter sp. V1I7]MDQ0852291.1 hypothetical protein [Arthrobacter sp. V4I6]